MSQFVVEICSVLLPHDYKNWTWLFKRIDSRCNLWGNRSMKSQKIGWSQHTGLTQAKKGAYLATLPWLLSWSKIELRSLKCSIITPTLPTTPARWISDYLINMKWYLAVYLGWSDDLQTTLSLISVWRARQNDTHLFPFVCISQVRYIGGAAKLLLSVSRNLFL